MISSLTCGDYPGPTQPALNSVEVSDARDGKRIKKLSIGIFV